MTTRMFVLGMALAMLQGITKAENFAEKMASYDPSQEMIVRGQNQCHPFYASVSAGWSNVSDVTSSAGNVSFDSGVSGNVALGWFEGNARVELEYSIFNFGLEDNAPFTTDVEAWLVSGYYDLPLTSTISGYAGAGIGVGRFSGHGFVDLTSELAIAYQARAGVTKVVTDRVDWFAGYRFLGLGTATINDGTDSITDQAIVHATIESGLRFKF